MESQLQNNYHFPMQTSGLAMQQLVICQNKKKDVCYEDENLFMWDCRKKKNNA